MTAGQVFGAHLIGLGAMIVVLSGLSTMAYFGP